MPLSEIKVGPGKLMDSENWLKECRNWCQQIKYLSEDIEWSERPNHSGWLEATSMLLDENRVTLPRLFFKGEYQPGRMGERVSYGLMYREHKEQRRVFMLEVWPAHVRSHRENGVAMFGPHIHLGDERLAQITREVYSKLGSVTMHGWVERFRRHAKIMDNEGRRLGAPFTADLFG